MKNEDILLVKNFMVDKLKLRIMALGLNGNLTMVRWVVNDCRFKKVVLREAFSPVQNKFPDVLFYDFRRHLKRELPLVNKIDGVEYRNVIVLPSGKVMLKLINGEPVNYYCERFVDEDYEY